MEIETRTSRHKTRKQKKKQVGLEKNYNAPNNFHSYGMFFLTKTLKKVIIL
jgi:hypothetical protein